MVVASLMVILRPENLDVKADIGGGNGNDFCINNNYIHNITENLSRIVLTYPKGRSFGTPGEIHTRDRIFNWSNDIGLWTTQERITSNYWKPFNESGHHFSFTSDLVVNSANLSVHQKNQNTQYINDFFICPRWDFGILRYLFGWPANYSDMTKVLNERNLSIYPRPYNVSDLLNTFIENHIDEILNDTEIMSGNDSALITYLLDQFQSDYNLSFENLTENPQYASGIQGFTNDTQHARGGDYVFIGENQDFKLHKDPRYWPHLNNILNQILKALPNRKSLAYKLVSLLISNKQCLEMLIWRFCTQCKGLLLYDFNDNTYDEVYRLYYSLPTIYINRSLGLSIMNDTENYTLNYTLDQKWNDSIESYNVIGQLNGTDTSKYVLIGCLYDGYHNQATADSAIGLGIMLCIAKYFNVSHIKPKINIRFVAFGGEETGGRGAYSYVYHHYQDHIPLMIDLNQFGYNQSDPRQALWITSNSDTLNETLRIIAHDTDFVNRTGNATDLRTLNVNDTPLYFSDHYPFYQNGTHDIISLVKENTSLPLDSWKLHHRDGLNHQEGDSMKYYTPKDVDATASLILNITRYYTMNPNCRFSNITFTAFDSPNDGDKLNDSIRTNFTIHSIMPSDKVRVEMDLGHLVGGWSISTLDAWDADYIVTNGSLNVSHTFTIPDNVSEGNYSVSFKVYNSTGRINRIINGQPSNYYNDTTGSSNWSHLYHPLGYTKKGYSTQSVQNRISGSVFTANENARADNITAFINQNFLTLARHKCMLYRANDSTLVGTTTENWKSRGGLAASPWWAVFNFTGTKPLLIKGVQYVITCWGNNSLSGVYYDESNFATAGSYGSYTYGIPPTQANFTQEPKYYSIYCSYTPDVVPPRIANVSHSPDTVGFGYNVTIQANVTDNGSGVNCVKAQIDHGYKSTNSTMTHISGNIYRYVFTDTWLARQYNYTIWAVDNSTNINSSTGHHFHVSATVTISIATLKDSYSKDEFINLTDPPNPQENLTLADRGLTWNTYYNASSGCNILETYQGPVNYQEDNGSWTPISTSLQELPSDHPAYNYGYRNGNDRGLFGVYFKPNAQNDWSVAFTYNRSDDPTIYVVRSKLVGIGYVDPQSNWAYKYLQNVQSSQGQTNGNSVTYPGVFTGTDVSWSYGNTELKEAITLSNATKTLLQNHPPSLYGLNNGSSYLVFITKLDHQNLDISNATGTLNGNLTITDGGVDFKDALGQFKCALPLGEAYELNNESVRQKLTYRIVHLNGDTYLLSGLKISDLNAMAFPVVIDPTLTVLSSSSDGYLYRHDTSYSAAWNASSSNGPSGILDIIIGQKKQTLTYYIYRGFVYFNTSALTKSAVIDAATLSLYKSSDSSTTDFLITAQNGQPTYPHDPLQSSDYNRNYYTGNGGILSTSGFGNGYNNIPLNSNGIGWINKSSWTKLCLRSSRDINGTAPTGNEYVTVYASEQGNGYEPKLVITYRVNQSKINNTGSTNIQGYLLIQVQFLDPLSPPGTWIVDNDTVNETKPRTINCSSRLALDTIFNGLVRASDLTHGAGTYRVYAAFRDPEGNILKTNTGSELKAWWQFNKT